VPPTFAVVIPAYESARTVGDAVASALGQTYPPQQVIVVDDGSTDDIATALAPHRDRIELVRQDHAGLAAARNRGIELARTDLVDFLDADDRFLPGRHEALAALATARPDLDLLTTDVVFEVDASARGTFYEANTFPVDDQRSAMLHTNFLTVMTACRRELVVDAGGFDSRAGFAEDWDLWIRLVLAGARIGLVVEPHAVYSLREDSRAAQRPESWSARAAALEGLVGDARLDGQERAAMRARAREQRSTARLSAAYDALARGSGDARRRALDVAFGADHPVSTRVKALLAAVAPGAAARRLHERGATASRLATRTLTAERSPGDGSARR
jgi:hypothetical protein